MNTEKKTLVFVGSYSSAEDNGVHVCHMDRESGELTVVDQVSGLLNPTFLEAVKETRRLYVLGEEKDAENDVHASSVTAFEFDGETGALKFLNKESNVHSPICHLHLDRNKRFVITASYSSGTVGLFPIAADGLAAPASEVHRHTGSSILPVQSQARAHSVFTDPSNRFALACDLGLDKIIIYKLQADAPHLVNHGETIVAPGAGPRHFAFHPSLPYGYVINELNATVTAFHFNVDEGKLTEIETVPTLPDDYKGDNACADIHVSADGLYLYGSNRGHDSIVVYAIDTDTGKLALVEHVHTRGGHPRNFALSPDGAFLLVANRDGNNVVIFRRDAKTGKLKYTGSTLTLPKPVCIKLID